jgi:hypothetical protein
LARHAADCFAVLAFTDLIICLGAHALPLLIWGRLSAIQTAYQLSINKFVFLGMGLLPEFQVQ